MREVQSGNLHGETQKNDKTPRDNVPSARELNLRSLQYESGTAEIFLTYDAVIIRNVGSVRNE